MNKIISARNLEFYSKARANKVSKLFIIWLQIGKAREIETTLTSTLPSFSAQFRWDNKIQKRSLLHNSQIKRYVYSSISCFFNEVSFSESY